jgi:hypothetical protein
MSAKITWGAIAVAPIDVDNGVNAAAVGITNNTPRHTRAKI